MSGPRIDPYQAIRAATLALTLWALPVPCPAEGLAQSLQVDVAEELERLMATYGFTIKPIQLEITRQHLGRAEAGSLIPRLRMLLEGFDHVIVQRPNGDVERVIILEEKSAAPPPPPQTTQEEEVIEGDVAEEGEEEGPRAEIVVRSQRKGSSHALLLGLEGEGRRRIERHLLLDTGADYVVLPISLIHPLGIRPEGLRLQSVQTANGTIEAHIGTLNAVWFANQRVPHVATAFIDDARLGGNALLGMSVLRRFRVTIDDAKGLVRLKP